MDELCDLPSSAPTNDNLLPIITTTTIIIIIITSTTTIIITIIIIVDVFFVYCFNYYSFAAIEPVLCHHVSCKEG